MPLPRLARSARALAALATTAFALLGPLSLAPVASADGGLVMTAHALLQGHARAGSWFEIAVDVENSGPTVTGELRIAGGLDSRTRFGTPVELATGSRKEYPLYAQPPTFGGAMTVQLVSDTKVVAEAKVAIALHEQTQLVVGIVAENPARVVGEISLLPSQSGGQAVLVPLTTADLPDRIQAWAPLDRLIWQDTDASGLKPEQLSALRGWVAGGGRLVIVGGTSGADALTGFANDLLPYRPTGVIDIDPSVLRPVLGGVPDGATTLTAYAGTLAHGRALATSGDRVVAADMPFGSGTVTLLGFDPTTSWIAKGDTWDTPLWRRLLPQRSGGTVSVVDDSMLVSGAASLPSLALPPTSGLLVLLVGYIILVGPVNYFVLRWLDRREWAWVTALALIAVFTAGSFGIGALTRGSSVIIHEVAIVRGAAGTDQASVQSWLGIFSPVRASFQLRAPGDTLLSAPISGDMFSGGQPGALDVLEGDPSRIRDLSVGYGSIRTVRAEGSTSGPVVDSDLRLDGGRLVGTVVNHSDHVIQAAAVVLGSSVQTLGDLAPGATVNVSLDIAVSSIFNPVQLSDKVVGSMNWDGSPMDEALQLKVIRRAVVDQLSVDPTTGMGFALPAASAVLLGWGRDPVVPVTLDGQEIRRTSDVLYEVPLRYVVTGPTVFRGDLLPSSLVDVNANFFSKDPWTIGFGTGNIVMAYRPVPFEGTFTAATVTVAMTGGGDPSMPGGQPVVAKEAARCEPATAGCVLPQDGLPDIEVLDVRTGAWVQFAHFTAGTPYTLPDAGRWVDPGTGEIEVKFVNETQNQIGFQFPVVLSGAVK